MRLIDADAMMKRLKAWDTNDVTDKALYNFALNRVLEAPTIEPERKKGEWIYNSPVTMKCDQCGFVIKDWDWHRFKFCPNCDCDMRGKQE